MRYSIGLDLSMSSTGICVRDNDTERCEYFIVAAKPTKRALTFSHERLKVLDYGKRDVSKSNTYSCNETIKTENLLHIVSAIRECIARFIELGAVAAIEGISYGSGATNALADLSGLNYLVREMLLDNGVAFKVIAPMANKKFAVGNGAADKSVMVEAWLRCEPEFRDKLCFKCDDIADAYFLSHQA